jgi:hypothetical protein
MLKQSLLTSVTLFAFTAISTTTFAGGVGDMGPRHAPVYHPAPIEPAPVVARECVGPLLKEGQWTINLRAGIAPTVRVRRTRLEQQLVDASTGQTLNVYSSGHHHHLPFTASADIGYVPMDNVEAFFNFDFATSSGAHRHLANTLADPAGTVYLSTSYKQDNLSSYGFYLGGRYFFELDDCKFSPFVGAKLGVRHHSNSKHKIRSIVTQNSTVLLDTYYKTHHNNNSTGFSGGVQAGLDYCLTNEISFFAMGEAIGTTGSGSHKRNEYVLRNTQGDAFYSRTTRSSGGNFTFPITAGIKVRM